MICAHCKSGDNPEEFVKVGERDAHIDCAYEYHLDHLMDPTARLLDETDAAYAERMKQLGL